MCAEAAGSACRPAGSNQKSSLGLIDSRGPIRQRGLALLPLVHPELCRCQHVRPVPSDDVRWRATGVSLPGIGQDNNDRSHRHCEGRRKTAEDSTNVVATHEDESVYDNPGYEQKAQDNAIRESTVNALVGPRVGVTRTISDYALRDPQFDTRPPHEDRVPVASRFRNQSPSAYRHRSPLWVGEGGLEPPQPFDY